ncbi:hypothetical protein [Paracidovorax citrulli]|uniref:hypothetical protein n=1 Tax=Paracidovorax citrulli TaxID=80869 RepID=UPI003FA6BC34
MKLTEKQKAALKDAAGSPNGQIFQLPERRTHSPSVLSALVTSELLKAEKVGVVWTITVAGRSVLAQIDRVKEPA